MLSPKSTEMNRPSGETHDVIPLGYNALCTPMQQLKILDSEKERN